MLRKWEVYIDYQPGDTQDSVPVLRPSALLRDDTQASWVAWRDAGLRSALAMFLLQSKRDIYPGLCAPTGEENTLMMDTRQTLLYCLHCKNLTLHWRRWFPLIGTHYICEVCEVREREAYAHMAQGEEIDMDND